MKEKDTYWPEWVETWKEHVLTLTSVEPVYSAKELKGLKDIRKYFSKQKNRQGELNNDEQSLYCFKYILANWKRLDNFKQNKLDTVYIASNIPEYIKQMKEPAGKVENILSMKIDLDKL